MAFEDLREQLKDRANEAMAKIQESSTFNTLRERYESQTPSVQRLIVIAGITLTILMILSIPMSYISSGSEYLSQFDENRQLIQGLLRAARSAKEPPALPPPQTPESLQGSIQRVVREAGLLPDQVGPIASMPGEVYKEFAPPGVSHTAMTVQLKKLNVDQILEIGNMLQNMAPGVKLIGIEVVQSEGQTHYYDMIAAVMSFGMATPDVGEDSDATPSGRGAGKK